MLQQFIHPLGERVGNYRLIFVHDLSVPERRRAQVLSLMKMRRDTSERTRSHALAASHVSMVENAGKAGNMTVQTVIGCIERWWMIPRTSKTPIRQRGAYAW